MPFCSKCGKEISEEDAYCRSCGVPLTTKAPATAATLATQLAKPRSKNKAVIKTLIGITCLAAFTYFFTTMSVRFYQMLNQMLTGSLTALPAEATDITRSALISVIALPIAYLFLRHIKKDWKTE